MRSVDVIIPVYNDPHGIRLALDALLGQTYPRESYRIIVVDNGSHDETRSVLQQFQATHSERVRWIVEDRIQGSYAARNRGVAASHADILAFTDADCVPAPDWLAKGVAAVEAHGADLVAGRIEMTFRSAGPTVWEYFDAARKLNQRAYVERAGFGATANLFVRRALLQEGGAFRSDLKSGGDYELGRRLTRAGAKLIYAQAAVVRHPARATLREILKKTVRIAVGQAQLARLGLLDHGTLTWRRLVPTWRCPRLPGVSIERRHRVALVLASNLVKYLNVGVRLVSRLRRGASGRTRG